MAKTIKITGFSGINNVKKAWELGIDPDTGVAEAVALSNYDIDNANKAIMRGGRAKISSVWAASDSFTFRSTVYGQQGGDLVSTQDFLTVNTLVRGIGTARLTFTPAEDLLVWSNGSVIEFIYNGGSYPFPSPTEPFQAAIPAGQCIAYYMGCLYIAVDDTLWQTEPVATGAFIDKNPENGGSCRVHASQITAVLAVNGGIWVSDLNSLWFAPGGNLQEMVRAKYDNCYALSGVSCEVRQPTVGAQVQGIVHYVGTNRGIVLLGDNAAFLPLTEKKYTMPASTGGSMAFVQRDGLNQVIAILNQ